jgi:predicted ATPase/signal transduction histidine kinase/tRNA A-37 threonylcarbamoyl transferase component Bud32
MIHTLNISSLSSYTINEKIYESSRTIVYRGERIVDKKPVVIKVLRNEYPSFKELVLFRNQYNITNNLKSPGIITTYSLENYQNSYALVMEDFGGISLLEWRSQQNIEKHTAIVKLNGEEKANNKQNNIDFISEFLNIAIQVVTTLDELSRNQIIHKDIKPTNILINPLTKQVKVIDFSISTLLPKETQTLLSPNILEGTLAYISPEQTGRMNRGIDYRSDFYSLGVTFFELLTGELPFQCQDPMELIHCHIAKSASPIHSINPSIPPILSKIVSKLMAKNAEERYQSALGIKHDLEICLSEWKEKVAIKSFELASRDIADCFVIPEKLYGRETEIAAILAAFERIAGNSLSKNSSLKSKFEIMLVAGFSGIGKTAVVNEVHKPIIRQNGYFIKGKFDQFQRDIPLSAFVQSFQNLIEQIISENNAQIENWRIKILDALGENAQVIIDVIPELEKIIGKQPAVPDLSGTANQNRFYLLFNKFVQAFTAKEHPLVIFLDDLQWADSTSLQFIKLLSTESNTNYLLIIGAYRDNEIFPAHPLTITLDEIREASVTVNTINLCPLDKSNINHLISDTLNCPLNISLQLTELVYQKTKGNPFFTTQFLKSLYEDNLIKFDLNLGYWQCDISEIKSQSITDDVVEFMALQLQKMPKSTQQVLKLAASIGNNFDLNTLSIVYQKSESETSLDLWKALQEGLILPQSEIYKLYQNHSIITDNHVLTDDYQQIMTNKVKPNVRYKFLHDRVQQAAYSLIPLEEKQITHLVIGRLLLEHYSESQIEERVFEIVNHLNTALELIQGEKEKNKLANLNYIAGCKARNSTAYKAGVDYFSKGISLLSKNAWKKDYILALKLHEDAAEIAYLSGDFSSMEYLAELVIKNAKLPVHKVKVYDAKIQAFGAQAKPKQAVDIALFFLKLLGVDLLENPNISDIDIEMEKIINLFNNRDIRELINLPLMLEIEALAAMRILSSVITLAYQASPNIFLLITLKQIELSLKYGNTALSAFSYVVYGFILSGLYGKINFGYELGRLGINLLNKLPAKEVKAKVIDTYNANLRHWKEHVRETLKPLLESYNDGMETGDLEFAGLSIHFYCYASYYGGKELASLKSEFLNYSQALQHIKQDRIFFYNEIYRQLILNLTEEIGNPCLLIGTAYDESKMLPLHIERNDGIAALNVFFCKQFLCYLFGDFLEAINNGNNANKYIHAGIGNIVFLQFHFYYALAQLAVYDAVDLEKQQQILTKVEEIQEKMHNWAHHAPMNSLHKFYLIEAERCKILGKTYEAMDLYDRSIALAKENQYIQEEALANELACKFYLQLHREKIAQVYIIEAYYCYAKWGAVTKLNDLEKHYPQLLTPILKKEEKILKSTGSTASWDTTSTLHSSTSSSTSTIDFLSVMKASQAISEALHLDDFLAILMRVVLENAGASKCIFILKESNQLVLKANINSLNLQTQIFQSISIEESLDIPVSLVNHVFRNGKHIAIDNVTSSLNYQKFSYLQKDTYFVREKPQSILCMPIINQGKIAAILYLENNLTIDAFTSDRIKILNFLCSQAAISLENARLYQQSQENTQQLEISLENLKQMQLQLVQSEKMSALGNLVSGVAHEINNPIGFIAGNLGPAGDYVQDLFELIDLYQKYNPQPDKEIANKIYDVDLDYIKQDLPNLLASMNEGIDRITNISNSLRSFSRSDSDKKVLYNIHEGLNSTLLILKHRLKGNTSRPNIEVIKNYGDIPEIKCYPGPLNQVFMNLIANAIDALDDSNDTRSYSEIEKNPNVIFVETNFSDPRQQVEIRIRDNGIGMSDQVKQKIFDHLYTTKPVGKGTGLGLPIVRQIVIEKHSGSIEVNSSLGQGAEFVITIPVNPG